MYFFPPLQLFSRAEAKVAPSVCVAYLLSFKSLFAESGVSNVCFPTPYLLMYLNCAIKKSSLLIQLLENFLFERELYLATYAISFSHTHAISFSKRWALLLSICSWAVFICQDSLFLAIVDLFPKLNGTSEREQPFAQPVESTVFSLL